jgi:hypothetical protein
MDMFKNALLMIASGGANNKVLTHEVITNKENS